MKNISNLQHDAFEVIDGDFSHGVLLIADHASNYIPAQYNNLGLTDDQLSRHIAYDIGTWSFTHKLAKKLNVPAVLSKFSRLLIDPNRGEADPTLVMRIADGEIVQGNRDIDLLQKNQRIESFYRPYDAAIGDMIDEFKDYDVSPSLFSIHSFTPTWRGNLRPTEVGMLWHEAKDFTMRVVDALKADTHYVVHDNQPYKGGLVGDTMDRHGLAKGLEHSLLELRQDYMSSDEGIDEWVEIFANILPKTVDSYKK